MCLAFLTDDALTHGCRCLLPEDGPGSLNRFVKRTIYEMTPETPTSARPPRFYLLGEYNTRPAQTTLTEAMARYYRGSD